METCAIMEREARKVQEKEHAGNSKDQVCLSNARKDKYNIDKETLKSILFTFAIAIDFEAKNKPKITAINLDTLKTIQ